MHRHTLAAALLCALVLPAGALAQDAKADKKPAPAAATADKAPAAQPTHDAGDPMAMMMELSTPGEEHALLKQFEGKWKSRMKFWFEPGEPQISEGVMHNTLVLGGRFLRHEYRADMMGMPFQGLGYWGYDKAKKEWIGSWMDTWGTGMMNSGKGTYDAATRTWTMHGAYFNPETQKDEVQREVIRLLDADTHTMEMYMAGPDGKEHKTMEITYTRMKGETGKETAPGQQKKDEPKKEDKKEDKKDDKKDDKKEPQGQGRR